MSRIMMLALASSFLILISACNENPAASTNSPESESAETTHDHGHQASGIADSSEYETHRHGIHGGHIFEFSPAEFLGEWVQHRDSDLIQIFILDLNGKSDMPQKVDSLIIKRGDTLFSLDPESSDENGNSAVYSLEDKDLSIAMNLGVDVELFIGEREFTAQINAHDGHHH